MRNQGGRGRWLWPVLLLLALGLVAFKYWQNSSVPVVTTAAVEVLKEGDSRATAVLEASGYVVARRQATVSSKVTGKVTEVLIEEGMKVEEGQVMARLDDTIAQRQLAVAESELVAAGGRQAETRVRLAEARRNLERTQSLVESGVGSESSLDRDRAEVDSLKARLDAEANDVAVSRSVAALRRQEMEDTVIRAPFTGVAISKNAQPGEMISPVSSGGFTRTGISTLVDMSSLEIEVDVNEAFIQRAFPGQPSIAILDAYPDWKIPARVITIVPAADRQKATVRVRIGFDQLDPRILPDMGVKVSLLEPVKEAGVGSEIEGEPRLRIPRAALRQDGDQEVVWVVEDEHLRRRAVRLGRIDDRGAEVVAGLAGGERVMIEGPVAPSDGDRVKSDG
ncbi:MAG: efflux RND transporter periplasmic adaptor subunit [Thermoanaerobaculia bacterium]|nr:efflux RND transporter periplasmic adaptor subunit [Thermoanaerobaculia bacterium]